MVRFRIVMMAALLGLAAAQEAEAQCRYRDRHGECRERRESRGERRGWGSPVEFGVRGGYDFEEETALAGAQLRVPLASQLLLSPSFDVFFDDARTQWQLNGDLVLRPHRLAGVYGGLGVAFLNGDFEGSGDSDTEVGLNVLVGLEGSWVGGTTVRPFAEGRWTNVDDYDVFRLSAGINVPVSR